MEISIWGGETIYKLVSIDNTRSTLTDFIQVLGNNIGINGVSLNPANKVLSVDYSFIYNNNKNSNYNQFTRNSPSVQITVPKALISGINDVTSENYNRTQNSADKAIDKFKIKETRKVSNVGDTLIDIQLNKDTVGGPNDKILIRGQTSPATRVSEMLPNNDRIILR